MMMYHIYDAIIILCSDPYTTLLAVPETQTSTNRWSVGAMEWPVSGFPSPETMTMAIIRMDDLKKEITMPTVDNQSENRQESNR